MAKKTVKDLMLELGFSLGDLSERTNIVRSKLSHVLGGKERVWPGYRLRIAKALNVKEEEILWPEIAIPNAPDGAEVWAIDPRPIRGADGRYYVFAKRVVPAGGFGEFTVLPFGRRPAWKNVKFVIDGSRTNGRRL